MKSSGGSKILDPPLAGLWFKFDVIILMMIIMRIGSGGALLGTNFERTVRPKFANLLIFGTNVGSNLGSSVGEMWDRCWTKFRTNVGWNSEQILGEIWDQVWMKFETDF